jgi:hypothetical protein
MTYSYSTIPKGQKMNIQFDTASLNPTEAQAIIALLSVLYGQPSQQSVPALTTFHEQLKASVEQTSSGPVLVEPTTTEATTTETTTKRTRRTREQIAADKGSADADRTPTVGDQLIAAEAARKAAAEAQQNAVAPNGATKIDADQLRALLNDYIARHSMEDAIEKLRAFGCNRVTEALALESVKLNELAATLNG